MFKINRFIYCQLIIIMFCLSSLLLAQEKKYKLKQDISRDSLLILARTIVDSADSKTFITVDQDGKPQARIMSSFAPEEDWVIWLGTSPKSRKVKQIKNNPNVMVFYYDSDSHSYVSVAGQARLVSDSDKKTHYWKKGWTRYYPDPEKDYVLIKVTPKRIELCSYRYKLFWDETGKPAFIEF